MTIWMKVFGGTGGAGILETKVPYMFFWLDVTEPFDECWECTGRVVILGPQEVGDLGRYATLIDCECPTCSPEVIDMVDWRDEAASELKPKAIIDLRVSGPGTPDGFIYNDVGGLVDTMLIPQSFRLTPHCTVRWSTNLGMPHIYQL